MVQVLITNTVYPLDVAKTRAQLHSAKGNLGMISILSQMVKQEGGFKMYRGILPLILMESKLQFLNN